MTVFRHAAEIWRDFPELVAGVVYAGGVGGGPEVRDRVAEWTGRAGERLGGRTESELPEIQAWRRAFARMGLKPTKYRCAAESLLRRYRREGALPAIHPLVDLCNAVSLAFVDAARRAHARRWTNRQSGHSIVRPATSEVLVVAEAMHDTAVPDITALLAALTTELDAIWSVFSRSAVLTEARPDFPLDR